MESILRIQRDIPGIESEIITSLFGFPITNTTLTLVLVVLLVLFAGARMRRVSAHIPGGFQNMLELFYETLMNAVQGITGTRERAERIFPLISALFVFIILSNTIAFLPGLSSILFEGKSIFRTPTSDFNTTFGLAFAMVLFLQVVTIREFGIVEYFGRFFQFHLVFQGFKKGIGEGCVAVINFCIGLLDIISECAKVVSLSLRLFGNMFAGEVLATIIIGGFAFGLPAVWMSMSMLSAVVQTIVFSFLVTAYYTMVLKPEE